MRLVFVAAVLCVVFLLGCATQQAAPKDNTPVTTDTPPQIPTEQPTTTEPTAPAAAGAEVTLNGKAGFDPAEVKIKAGDALTVIVNDAEKDHKFAVSGLGPISGSVADGEKFDYTFETAGTYRLQDLTFKQVLVVTVE